MNIPPQPPLLEGGAQGAEHGSGLGPSILHSLFTVLGNINVSVDTAASGSGTLGGQSGKDKEDSVLP